MRLQAVPQPVLRDGVYVRVSAVMGRADERFLSPDIQRESIDRARQRGPASRVVQEWRDIDVSTARVKIADRPGLQSALTAARAGEIDRLWVLTLDRFDRDTGALRVFDEVTALGVELWTEAGRLDIDSAEGYLSTTMQLAIARYQRDRIGKAWKQTHQHRLERGLPHSGKPRAGYVYDAEARIHVPDPMTGPAIGDAYRRYVHGEPVLSLVRWLNDERIPTASGGQWYDRTLRRVLDSGFAAGILLHGGQEYPGAHAPLITRELWDEYRACRDGRREQHNTERSPYVLSGLVKCGRCGSAMSAGRYGRAGRTRYACRRGAETGAHTGGIVSAAVVEAAVLDWLAGIADQVNASVDLAKVVASARTRREVDAAALRREVAALEDQAGALVKHLVSGRLTEPEFDQAVAANRREQDDLRAALARAQVDAVRPTAAMPSRVAADLLADWDLLTVTARREVLRRLISRVEVTTGHPRATVVVVPRWGG